MAKRIALSGERGRGLYVMVDDADYATLIRWSWSAAVRGHGVYAQRGEWRGDGPNRMIYMHRQILGLLDAPRSVLVDHKNGDTLDNRRANLRVCSGSQNIANIGPLRGKRFKGTSWHKRRGLWVAGVQVEGRRVHLGYFVTEEEAARAYDRKAFEIWGEFAYLNFPKDADHGEVA